MTEELLPYYERELAYLRQLGAEFAAKYPKIASRLQLENETTEDPHVERLLQGVAFLAARIQHKLDDEFPEITDALLSVLHPHVLAPIPSMAIAQFVLAPGLGKLTNAVMIERGAMLQSPPVNGARCRFRTCYPLPLWPIDVSFAQLGSADGFGASRRAASVIRIGLRCRDGTTFGDLPLDSLRFFLAGEGQLPYRLYELLLNAVVEVQVRPGEGRRARPPVGLSPASLQPVGLAPDEGMLPYTRRSFIGYRLLQEYFAFPQKYLFIDIGNLQQATRTLPDGEIELAIFLDRMPRLEQPITAGAFQLGCTPIVNLFPQLAEPIRLSHTQTEYQVVPDLRRPDATEVYSVDGVVSTSAQSPDPIEFQPFYSFKHAADRERQRAYWYASRRRSPRRGDSGTDVHLCLVDLDFQPTRPPVETLTVHVTCTNRDLAGRLPFGGQLGDLELEGAAPLSRIRCLTKPTPTGRPPLRRGGQWRLLSHLSLNYLSLVEGGRDALCEILSLYDLPDSPAIRQQISGIVDVRSRRIVGRPASMPWNGFCRGLEVTIDFDEDKYVGSGLYLFASILEKFLGLYTSLNSFTQLLARSQQRQEPVKRWPPRAGEQILL